MKEEILRLLRSADGYISGQELCNRFGVSRTAVWKAINQLKEAGYEIEAQQNKGYRLMAAPDLMTEAEIKSLMHTDWVAKEVLYFDTIDSTNTKAQELLVEDGRILDVNCDVPAGECQVVDLHGKTVLPGFHDSHEHFLCYATDKEKINFFGIRSLEEMAERTRRYIADRGIKKGEWIQGGGWNENEFDVPVLPSRQDLDKFCPDNPAIFTRTCCSVAVANTAALKAAGIFDDIPTLQDGHIVVDENGVPTGMLHERARHLVYDILTKYTKEQLKQFILDYQKDLLSTGLTTVQTDDFKLWDATIDDILAAYEELDKYGGYYSLEYLPVLWRQTFA